MWTHKNTKQNGAHLAERFSYLRVTGGSWRLLKKILTFMVKDNVIGWSFSVTKKIIIVHIKYNMMK